jgi:hypothetical protein
MTEERPKDKGHVAEYAHRVHDRSKWFIDETVLGKWLEDRVERRWLVEPWRHDPRHRYFGNFLDSILTRIIDMHDENQKLGSTQFK